MINILGGIYVASIVDLNNHVDFKGKKITHILSLVLGPIPKEYTENYQHKQIEISDEPTTNIIKYFEEANKFIDSALFRNVEDDSKVHRGAILIHCDQGISRSPSFAIAYIMRKYSLSFNQALYAIRRRLKTACPNDGFIKQLRLFEEMGYKVDPMNTHYRELMVSNSLASDPTGRNLRKMDIFSFSNSESKGGNDYDSANIKREGDTELSASKLRCKRCRKVLALGSHIESHRPPDENSSQSQFVKVASKSGVVISSQTAHSACSHYFLAEPLVWMRNELEGRAEIEGKFQCPKCESKVGAYSWSGSRCSCGRWMVPAIHLRTSKVDYM